MEQLAGVVLCGGAGRRMGLQKAWLEIGGRTLLATVAGRLATVADPVLVAGADLELPELPFTRIDDAAPAAGPLGGIVAALRATDTSTAVVAVDMPFANPGVLRLLADLRNGADVALPVDGFGRQPLHAVYAPSALAPMERALAEGEFGIGDVLTHLRVRAVTSEGWRHLDPTGRFAFNVNEPVDLRELRREPR